MICFHGIIKLKVDKTIKGELREIENESVVRAEFIPLSETEFIVKCKIIENNVMIFEIQSFATSREQAVKIVKNWEDNVGEIYPKVTEMLNRKREEVVVEEVEEDGGQTRIC